MSGPFLTGAVVAEAAVVLRVVVASEGEAGEGGEGEDDGGLHFDGGWFGGFGRKVGCRLCCWN